MSRSAELLFDAQLEECSFDVGPFDTGPISASRHSFSEAESNEGAQAGASQYLRIPARTVRRPSLSQSLPSLQSTADLPPDASSTWRIDGGQTSWYDSSRSYTRDGSKAMWRPLGDTWRLRNTGFSGPIRSNPDDGSAFAKGCVPNWGGGATLRKHGAVEHDLTWAYYSMRRHAEHPLRKDVGEHMDPKDMLSSMRVSSESFFHFWRDLRPPFHVIETKRIGEGASGHVDGDLFQITYECGIDYCNERLFRASQSKSTFDNTVHGVALARIPNGFPRKRPMHLLSWGKPVLYYVPDEENKVVSGKTGAAEVNAYQWLPIASELGCRPDEPRLEKCRDAARRVVPRDGFEVKPLQRLLLGPHASLPRLARMDEVLANAKEQVVKTQNSVPPQEVPVHSPKKRKHRIWTSAAGFISYAG